ncbi:MAG: ComEC/Rec2 family competence protein, partial [Hyphococcus sp.]
VISGGGWSARRAFIMAAIVFAAVIADRRALSLRNVAIAACAILLTTPEALFHPGFQMSFAAVTALIAAYEWLSRHADPFRSFSLTARLRRYAAGLVITDVIAALATAPYALYHFNRVALYSLPANVLSMPLMGFWIIPAAVVALILAPFGLDGWAWRLSAAGVESILVIASEVSNWPGAVSLTPQWPLGAMLALTIGGLWLCLARSPLRLAGLAAMPIAALFTWQVDVPDIYVAASGVNAGVLTTNPKDGIAIYNPRRDRFAAGVWREAAGFAPENTTTGLAMSEVGGCDRHGCVVDVKAKGKAAFLQTPDVLAEDCSRADVVVAFFPVSARAEKACNAVLIDRRSVWRSGAHAVWLGEGGASATVRTVGDMRGQRPWTGGETGR